MAKPHKFAWNGVDAETTLSIEQIGNMAQRSALECTGDLLRGKMRIVSTRSSDQQIEFRVNDYLISFKKLMVFHLTFTARGGRTFMTSTIEWYVTTQPTVGGFVPVGTKSMVAHHVYMQFANHLAAQIRAADPTARVRVREGVEPVAPASSSPEVPSIPIPPAPAPALSGAAAAVPPPPPPRPSPVRGIPVPPAPPAGTPRTVIPVPPPPSAAPAPFAVPPPPPAAAPAPASPPPPPPAPQPIGAVPGQPAYIAPTSGRQALVTGIPGIQPIAAQQFVEDEDLDATRASQVDQARPWLLEFADGQAIRADSPIAIGRAPSAPAQAPTALPVPVNDPHKSVSKTHALLEVRGGMLWVTDLQSTNGTTVTNAIGEAIECPATVAMPVGDGWVVSVGAFTIATRLGE